MKLLSKPQATSRVKLENDSLVNTNIRLRQYERAITERLNTLKDDYEPDKMAKLKEFELFCKDLDLKRAKLLQELSSIEKAVEDKKELYYALVTKQDALEEKFYSLSEKEKKVDLREAFVVDLEKKWQEKQ